MSKPMEIIEKYYKCPYCERFESYTESDVRDHMERCGHNPNLPKRDCSSCANAYYREVKEKAGHDRGYRPTVVTRRQFCSLGCKFTPGAQCASYQPNGEEPRQ